jgi:hypothetical protein
MLSFLKSAFRSSSFRAVVTAKSQLKSSLSKNYSNYYQYQAALVSSTGQPSHLLCLFHSEIKGLCVWTCAYQFAQMYHFRTLKMTFRFGENAARWGEINWKQSNGKTLKIQESAIGYTFLQCKLKINNLIAVTIQELTGHQYQGFRSNDQLRTFSKNQILN